ncbi:MAG TPA: hypothetical protein PK625_04545 [Spirochaetales bacterium]|nr:hypothetical protein [Spirochaetales bacterium]
MKEGDESLGAGDRIALIEDMLAAGRQRFVEDGTIYVLWGCVAVAGSFLHWLLARLTGLAWIGPVVWGVGFVVGIVLAGLISSRRQRRARGIMDNIVLGVWIGMYISLALTMALAFMGMIPFTAYISLLCVLLGFGYWAVSQAVQFPTMRLLAVGWWAGGIACALVPGLWPVLVLNVLVLVCEILPGLAMIRSAAKEAGHAAG